MIQEQGTGNNARRTNFEKGLAYAKKHPRAALVAAALAALLLVAAGLVWNGLRAVSAVRGDVAAVVASLRAQDMSQLTSPQAYTQLLGQVRDIEERLASLRRQSQVTRIAGWVPGPGTRLTEGRVFLEMSSSLAHAARLTMEGYLPAVQEMAAPVGQRNAASLGQAMESSGPLFNEALAALEEARLRRDALTSGAVLGENGEDTLALVDQAMPLLELAARAASVAPGLIGEALELQDLAAQLRRAVQDPLVLVERPAEMQEQFASLRQRAIRLQSSLLEVQAAVQGADPRVDEALGTVMSLTFILAGLGDALTRFSALFDQVFTLGPLQPESAVLLGSELPQLQAQVESARAELARLNQSFAQRGGSQVVAFLSGALGSPGSPLKAEESLLATGSQAIDFLSYFLGYDGPQTYLLIGQNNDEIRATGGFLGVVAQMDIAQGELTSLRFLDSVSVDAPDYALNPIAPEPIFRYLWMTRWLFRDANWNPNFPTAATQVADLYQRGRGVASDGVIATTEELILDLVEVFGDITVPELPFVLDRATAERYVEGELPYQCQPRHVSDRGKRCFDEDLFQSVIQRLLSPIPAEQRPGLVSTFLGGLHSKDLLLHVFDQQAAELLWEQEWNGALRQVDHDYLMVVDSSLPGHARSVVQRRVQYEVRLGQDQPIDSRLRIEYKHTGTTPDSTCRQAVPTTTGCYWNYLRVYLPVTAQDLAAPPVPVHEGAEWLIWGYEPADSLSVINAPRGGLSAFTEVGGYIPVEPQTSVTLPLSYKLPAQWVRPVGSGVYEYRLLVQRQPGTPVEPMTLFVELPEGAALVDATPAPSAQQGRWVRMDVQLERDTLFRVSFLGP